MTWKQLRPCPTCAGDLRLRSRRHCSSRTCSWRRCDCGTVVSPHGLWIAAPPRSSTRT